MRSISSRTSPILFLALLAASCGRGPSFDERKKNGIEAFQEKRIPDAVELLDGCARENPRDFDVRYYLARSQEEAQNFAVALREWDDVLLLRPEFPEAHYRKGNTLAGLGRLDEAIASWQSAVDRDPTFARAYYNQGAAYENLEKWDDAARCYVLATRADSTFAPAWIDLGLLLQRATQWEGALLSFDRAIRLQPSFTAPYLNRIQILMQLGRKDEAIERIRELEEREGIDTLLADSLRALRARLAG